jgi:hypothetical protein
MTTGTSREPPSHLVLPDPRELQALADRSSALLQISLGLHGSALRRAVAVDCHGCRKTLRIARVWGVRPRLAGVNRELDRIASELGQRR